MIKIDIDLRDATNAEIDTLYGMPGFGNVLRELKDSGNRYNAVLTVREPGDESEALVSLLMEFMRKQKMQVGDVIPEKPYRFEFVPSLNPRQQELLPHMFESFATSRWLQKDGEVFRLTEDGLRALY